VQSKNTVRSIELTAITVFALGLFLPYRAIQYDTNGIDEAQYIEDGRLFHKNHMVHRPLGYALFRGAKTLGYEGNSLGILQIMNAVLGAIGVGLAYVIYEFLTADRLAALVGSVWLATSFTYWYFSTDAGYIMLAGLFALAALACSARRRVFPSSVFTALSVLTWEASIFLVPIPVGEAALKPRVRAAVLTLLLVSAVYIPVAFSQGYYTPFAILHWISGYGEGPKPLPLWGAWAWDRIPSAALAALRSITPVLLAAWPGDFARHVQLGRIAVDLSLFALAGLLFLAAARANRRALSFVAGYALFLPFIIWWDPYDPKWFLIPNIFLGGFLASGLAPWLQRKPTRIFVLAAVIVIGGTNFVTTILPRHRRLGPARTMAQCVSEKMTSADLFVSAEWGWPEYLGYLHGRRSVSFINDGISLVKERESATEKAGGKVYMLDPRTYSQAHLDWLKIQTGVSAEDLAKFGGSPSFSCNGVTLLRVGL
jgi:hypothetical protein